ncbi:probable sodium/metabolite cotransporter BASS3, chloroplastic isoform X2 [Helianthus annuus]|uniref:probable sodium/metabolite cotransporter BASS3, chloroplastic isoform X2 n=1 Tax=Helianthus annuus TaxID=4232 RepID=UPI0016530481|nr:probable sodium/metabolite cotransporter BASS3, chloroplastic isoform X2 [Helianthus annuus]
MVFGVCLYMPLPLSMGFLAQYALKPVLGVFVARLFGVAPMFYAGFVLMACVSSAQLSSYGSFLSKGDVALKNGCNGVSPIFATRQSRAQVTAMRALTQHRRKKGTYCSGAIGPNSLSSRVLQL